MTFTILCQALKGELAKPKTRMFMNLTALLLLVGCLQVTAGGFSQNVTISRKDVPVEKVFREIKKQTGYSFFYKAGLLQNLGNVTVDVKNTSFNEVLEACLKGEPFTFSVVNKTIVITRKAETLSVVADSAFTFLEIRGRVTDEVTGDVIAGANISVKKSALVVTTGEGGQFILNADAGAVLVVSYVGYISKEITVKDASFISVKLKPNADKKAEEMVITGYQRIRKESFTGNEVTVSGADLKKMNPQNILAAMQAYDPSFRVAENNLFGSDPNRLSSVTVRGSTTIPSGAGQSLNRNDLSSNYNQPTFILDGYEVDLQKVFDLDMNRVETVTLLKDAAATAIYGSRASNGVLVITTRSPKEGKLQLSYNYEANYMTPDLTGYNLLDGRQKLEYERLAGFYTSGNKATSIGQDDLDVLYYQKKKMVESGINTYWLSQPLHAVVGQKHSAYIEGGSKQFRYGIDLRHQNNPGVMKGSGRERNSVGMSFSYSPTHKFIFKNEITVTHTLAKESPYGGFDQYARMNPYYPIYDSTGKVLQEVDGWYNRNNDARDIQRELILSPLYDATLQSFNKSKYIEFIDAFNAEWNISDALRLRGTGSINSYKMESDNFKSPLSNEFYTYAAADLIKRGRYDYADQGRTILDGNLVLTYNKQIGDHFINFALGANAQNTVSDYKSFRAIGFTNDRFTNIGFANSYAENSHPASSHYEGRLFGAFLSGNYSYKNKYLADLTIRADGSSKFGTENKVAPFWSVGLGWNVHKEDFLRNTAISTLKLKASTGLTGAVSFPPYLSKTTYTYLTDSWYSTGVGTVVDNYGNEKIKWQRTRNYEAGFDMGLFKDKLFFSGRYYYKLTTDLLADIVLPPSTGFSFYKDNLGDMVNKGYEFNLKYQILKGRNYSVSINGNLAHNTNIIKKISNALTEYNKGADDDQVKAGNIGLPLLRFKEGQSLNTIYGVRSLGIDPENGRELFRNSKDSLTYEWSVKDITAIGDLTPKAEGFFGTTVAYDRFIMTLSFYYRFGGQTYNQTLVDKIENADPRFNVDERALTQRWQKPGDHVFYKNIQDFQSTQVSSRFIQKDDVMELKTVYLSYDFNKAVYSKLSMRNLRLSFTMNDVFRLGSLKAERGTEYPFARNFTLSVQTSF